MGTQGEGKPAKESVAIQVEKKAGKQANKKTEKQVEKKAKAALLRPKQAEPKRGTSYSAESLCKMTCLICNTGSPQSYWLLPLLHLFIVTFDLWTGRVTAAPIKLALQTAINFFIVFTGAQDANRKKRKPIASADEDSM